MMNDVVFIIPDRSIQYTDSDLEIAASYAVVALVEIIKDKMPTLPWYPSDDLKWRKAGFSDLPDFFLLGPPVPDRQPLVSTIYLTNDNLYDVDLRNIITTTYLFDDLDIADTTSLFTSTFALQPEHYVGDIRSFYMSVLKTTPGLIEDIGYYLAQMPKGGALSLIKP